jgi:hypothetical protein
VHLVRRFALLYPWADRAQSKDDTMIMLLNLGRLLMVVWIIYALVLLFAPNYLHRSPDNFGASMQAVAAFVLGHLMDRAVGMLRRRKATQTAAGVERVGESGAG